jgi:hypothetical protein
VPSDAGLFGLIDGQRTAAGLIDFFEPKLLRRRKTLSSDGIELTLFSKPQLLITESAEEFAALNAALMEEIKPCGILERLYVADVVSLVWEILRLRRCKAVIVNTAFKNALSIIVCRLAGEPEMWGSSERNRVDALVRDWFSKAKARKEVLQLLAEFHLDEFAIEAEAIRSVLSELEVLDKMLTLQESRRNKALRSIADYRDGLAKQVREVSNRVIESDGLIKLENLAARRSA